MFERIGYLTEEQFLARIGGELGGTFQPLDVTLTALSGRGIGAAAGTDILDRNAGDGRYALTTHTHAIADVAGLQTALDGKEPSITAGTTSQYWRGDKSWQTLNKAAVGLGNVDNTSDANKPVSTAQQTALNLKAPLASPAITGTATAVNLVLSGILAPMGWDFLRTGVNATLAPATHGGKIIVMNNTLNRTLTLSAEATNAWASSTIIIIMAAGSNPVSIARAAGVQMIYQNGDANRSLAAGGMALLIRDSADLWYLAGSGIT